MSKFASEDDELSGGGMEEEYLKSQRAYMRKMRSSDVQTMRKEVAEWMGEIIGEKISSQDLMNELRSGVKLLRFAKSLHLSRCKESQQPSQDADKYVKLLHPEEIDEVEMSLHSRAQMVARQRSNISKFLEWSGRIGARRITLFESEDLVLNRNELQVMTCILHIARIAAKFGVEPPESVKEDIKYEEEKRNSLEMKKNEKPRSNVHMNESGNERTLSMRSGERDAIPGAEQSGSEDNLNQFEIAITGRPPVATIETDGASSATLAKEETSPRGKQTEDNRPRRIVMAPDMALTADISQTQSQESHYIFYDDIPLFDVASSASGSKPSGEKGGDTRRQEKANRKWFKTQAALTLSCNAKEKTGAESKHVSDDVGWNHYALVQKDEKVVDNFLPKRDKISQPPSAFDAESKMEMIEAFREVSRVEGSGTDKQVTDINIEKTIKELMTDCPPDLEGRHESPELPASDSQSSFSSSSTSSQVDETYKLNYLKEFLDESPTRLEQQTMHDQSTTSEDEDAGSTLLQTKSSSIDLPGLSLTSLEKEAGIPLPCIDPVQDSASSEISRSSMEDLSNLQEQTFRQQLSTSSTMEESMRPLSAGTKEMLVGKKIIVETICGNMDRDEEGGDAKPLKGKVVKDEAELKESRTVSMPEFIDQPPSKASLYDNRPGALGKFPHSRSRYKIPIIVISVLILIGIGGIVTMAILFPRT